MDLWIVIYKFTQKICIYAVPLLIAVIAHEVAHGWVAEKLGDPTARLMGRISMNPIVHIDPFGTIVIPLFLVLVGSPFLFGWAKPVPVNFQNLRGGRKSIAWVSLAGPLTNLMLAFLSAVVCRLVILGYNSQWLANSELFLIIVRPIFLMARFSVVFNLVLMVFNLFPVPPLDGGRVLMGLLPVNLAWQLARLERFGILIVLALIVAGAWEKIMRPILGLFLNIFLG